MAARRLKQLEDHEKQGAAFFPARNLLQEIGQANLRSNYLSESQFELAQQILGNERLRRVR